MNNLMKVIAYLYAGIVAANATAITFDGKVNPVIVNRYIDYINIDFEERDDGYVINKVSINEGELKKSLSQNNKESEEFTLVIPNTVNNKKIEVKEGAFRDLNAKYLRLKLKFAKGVLFPKNCSELFYDSKSIIEIDLSGVDSEQVTDTRYMFAFCSNLKTINFGNFNTSNVTDMSGMFNGCWGLTDLDLSNFNTINVTDMGSMFTNCESLTSLNLSNFKTEKVTNMSEMFKGCSNLVNVDVRSFDMRSVTNKDHMFAGCISRKR